MRTNAPDVKLADVEWRVDSKPTDGDRGIAARFVPHVNARIAARLMDEWVGPENWSDEYRTVTIAGKEAILCTVSVCVQGLTSNAWVSKQDVGIPSAKEAQKGGISDAFKRCVTVKWGAGRNVYDLPTLWAPCRTYKNAKGELVAAPNDQTLPSILAQLQKRGFEDIELGGTVEEDEAAAGSGLVESIPSSPAFGKESGADDGPAAAPEPRIGKATLTKLESRVSALLAAGVEIADKRRAKGLPVLSAEISRDEANAWNAFLTVEEANAAPFEPAIVNTREAP